MEWHGTRPIHRPKPQNWEVPDSNGIAARIRRAERMNMDMIVEIWDTTRVADMTDAQVTIIEFFLRYHPDPYGAIESHKSRQNA